MLLARQNTVTKLRRRGSFWSRVFSDRSTLLGMLSAQETLHTGLRAQVSNFLSAADPHNVYPYAAEELYPVSRAAAQVTEDTVRYGKPTFGAFTFGQTAGDKCVVLPSNLREFSYLVNNPAEPTVAIAADDLAVDFDLHYLTLADIQPFAVPGGGYCFWLCGAKFDSDTGASLWGDAFSLPQGAAYTDVLGPVHDLLTGGGTRSGVAALLAACGTSSVAPAAQTSLPRWTLDKQWQGMPHCASVTVENSEQPLTIVGGNVRFPLLGNAEEFWAAADTAGSITSYLRLRDGVFPATVNPLYVMLEICGVGDVHTLDVATGNRALVARCLDILDRTRPAGDSSLYYIVGGPDTCTLRDGITYLRGLDD